MYTPKSASSKITSSAISSQVSSDPASGVRETSQLSDLSNKYGDVAISQVQSEKSQVTDLGLSALTELKAIRLKISEGLNKWISRF